MQSDFNAKILIELIVTALRSHPELHLAFEQGLVELELSLLIVLCGQNRLLKLTLWRAEIRVCQLIAPSWGVRIFSSTAAMLVDGHRVAARHCLVVRLGST